MQYCTRIVREICSFRRFVLAVALAGFGLWSLPGAQAQSLDNKGTDFILAFLPNFDFENDVELHVTADVATMVTVEYPVNSPTFTTTVAVSPGSITTVAVPNTAAQSWIFDTVQNNAVHAFAPDEFVCYMINRRDFSSDAALGLPVDTMNTEYIVTDYNPVFLGSEFTVVAGFDNTTVDITPSNDLIGRPAGVTFSVVLNRGEGYAARSLNITGPIGSLTGTVISADRPVGMTNGNGCPQVPNGTTACDHIFEVAQPVQTWGAVFAVTNLPERPAGSIYRILASQDNTTISSDPAGVVAGVIHRGEYLETPVVPGSFLIGADKPVYVTQFMTGQDYPGNPPTGDPAMGNMIPIGQWLNNYTFSTVGAGQFAQNYLSVVALVADITTLILDGSPIPISEWSLVGTTGLFATATVPISEGTHTTASSGLHGITVVGINDYDSYIYPGGALFQFINPVGDENPPICSFDVAGNPQGATGTAEDSRPSEDTNGNGVLDPGEDLNGNEIIDEDTGIFFVELLTGASNVVLTVDPFVPGDPLVGWTLDLIDPTMDGSATVRATDGAGNTCAVDVELIADTDDPCSNCGVGDVTTIDSNGDVAAWATIQDALNAARADSTIEIVAICDGYYSESLLAWDLEGVDVIACGDVVVNGFMIKSCSDVSVTGIAVAPTGFVGFHLTGNAWANQDIHLVGCSVSGAPLQGLRIGPSNTNVLVEGCEFSGNGWGIRSNEGAGTCTVRGSTISGNTWGGVYFSVHMDVVLEENQIVDNGWYGIVRRREAGAGFPENITLLNNYFSGNNGGVKPGISDTDVENIDQVIDGTDFQPPYTP